MLRTERSSMNDNNNKNNSGGNRNGQSLIIFLVCLMVGLIGMSLFSGALDSSTSREITYDKFIDMLENDEIASVEISSSRLEITPKSNGNDVKIVIANNKSYNFYCMNPLP